MVQVGLSPQNSFNQQQLPPGRRTATSVWELNQRGLIELETFVRAKKFERALRGRFELAVRPHPKYSGAHLYEATFLRRPPVGSSLLEAELHAAARQGYGFDFNQKIKVSDRLPDYALLDFIDRVVKADPQGIYGDTGKLVMGFIFCNHCGSLMREEYAWVNSADKRLFVHSDEYDEAGTKLSENQRLSHWEL